MVALTKDILEDLKLNSEKPNDSEFPKLVLEELRERTGMLDGPGSYAFVHKSVAEFLFAELIVEGHTRVAGSGRGEKLDRQWLYSRRAPDRWRGVLYFWAGLAATDDRQGFIEALVESQRDEDRLLALGLMHDQLSELDCNWLKSHFLMLCSTNLTGQSNRRASWNVGLIPVDVGTDTDIPEFHSAAPNRWSVHSVYCEIVNTLQLSGLEIDCSAWPWAKYAWNLQLSEAMLAKEPNWWLSTKAIESAATEQPGVICLVHALFLLPKSLNSFSTTPPLLNLILGRWKKLHGVVAVVYVGVLVESQIAFNIDPLRRLYWLLPWVRGFEIDSALLARTSECSGFVMERDSLLLATELLSNAFNAASSEDQSLIKELMDYIDSLRVQRTALMSGQKHFAQPGGK